MSFLFPRKIKITRPNATPVSDSQSYSGLDPAKETVIAKNVSARIQSDRQGTQPVAQVAGDAAGQSIWKIIFKLPLGVVQDRDFITDDKGLRYQVISSYWGPMISTCRCQIMEN